MFNCLCPDVEVVPLFGPERKVTEEKNETHGVLLGLHYPSTSGLAVAAWGWPCSFGEDASESQRGTNLLEYGAIISTKA